MTWKPDTSFLPGDELRVWRESTPLTDEEYFGQLYRCTNHPTQEETAVRTGISASRYGFYERHGAEGCRAALLRIHMETGENVSNVNAPLHYFEQLAHYCDGYRNALLFLGIRSRSAHSYWQSQGEVRSLHGAGRLLRICWDRLGLNLVEARSLQGAKINRATINNIKRLSQQGMSTREIARCLGVGKGTAHRYSKVK